MPEPERQDSWDVLEQFVEDQNAEGLRDYLDGMSSGEIGRALTRMDNEDQAGLLVLLGPEDAADMIEELHDIQGADIMEELEPEEAAAILDEMESDHRVDVLREMDDEDSEAILAEMDPEEAADVRELIQYPDDVAGGIMVTEFLCYKQNLTVGDVWKDMRDNAQEYACYSVQYAYVLNEHDVLVGVIRLRDLLLADPASPMGMVMSPNPLYVYVDSPLDDLDEFFDRYPFIGAPVTNHDGHLVGVVRRADVEEAWGERAEQSLMRFGGIIGGEEFRSLPYFWRSSRRLVWLMINLVLSLAGSGIIMLFSGTIERLVALAAIMPVIANVSGCSGNQAVAVSIRELALGLIQPQDYILVWMKELQVALMNGVVIGLCLGGYAFLISHNLSLAIAAGGAMMLNSLVALSLGGLIPLMLKRFHVDPALAAPLFVTTFCDLCGFFVILSLGGILLSRGLI